MADKVIYFKADGLKRILNNKNEYDYELNVTMTGEQLGDGGKEQFKKKLNEIVTDKDKLWMDVSIPSDSDGIKCKNVKDKDGNKLVALSFSESSFVNFKVYKEPPSYTLQVATLLNAKAEYPSVRGKLPATWLQQFGEKEVVLKQEVGKNIEKSNQFSKEFPPAHLEKKSDKLIRVKDEKVTKTRKNKLSTKDKYLGLNDLHKSKNKKEKWPITKGLLKKSNSNNPNDLESHWSL